jgi:hypothetical protein
MEQCNNCFPGNFWLQIASGTEVKGDAKTVIWRGARPSTPASPRPCRQPAGSSWSRALAAQPRLLWGARGDLALGRAPLAYNNLWLCGERQSACTVLDYELAPPTAPKHSEQPAAAAPRGRSCRHAVTHSGNTMRTKPGSRARLPCGAVLLIGPAIL